MHPRQAHGKSLVGTMAVRACPGLCDPHGQGSLCPHSSEGSQASRAAKAGHAHSDTRLGPGQAQSRDVDTCLHKNNNNKNLLALQTAQPAQGHRLAWHFKPPALVQIAARPKHRHTHADAASSDEHTPEPPVSGVQQPHTPHPNPTTFQTETCFASLFLKEGLLSPLKLCMPRSRGTWARRGPLFWLEKAWLHLSPAPSFPRREAWGRLETQR